MYPAKKGWTRVTSGRLYLLYLEVIDHAKELKLWQTDREIPPLYTRKSVRTFGTCFANKCKDGSYDCAIVMNQILLDYSDDRIRKVLVHEVAHAIHPREHHNSGWRRDANRIGEKWGYLAEVCNSDKALNAALDGLKEKKYKYELYCPTCGQVWKYSRICAAIQHPERYRCRKDKSKLQSRTIV